MVTEENASLYNSPFATLYNALIIRGRGRNAFARLSERSKKMENKRKTRIEKGYAVEVYHREGGYLEKWECPSYNLALCSAKIAKKDQLYTGRSVRVRIHQFNKANNEVIKTYPEITL